MNRTEIRNIKRLQLLKIGSLMISSSLAMLLASLPILYGTGGFVVGWAIFGNLLFILGLYYIVTYTSVVPIEAHRPRASYIHFECENCGSIRHHQRVFNGQKWSLCKDCGWSEPTPEK